MSKKCDKNTKDSKGKKDGNDTGNAAKVKMTDDQKWERLIHGYYKEIRGQEEGTKAARNYDYESRPSPPCYIEIYSPVAPSEMRMILVRDMSCRPRVSLPFIPSTCLILADTSWNTADVWIKNHSSKSCLHHAATIMADYEWLHKRTIR